ncbi:hypothetical protein NS228_26890 [Methylobacterium indicum]|uniref:Uncharacterized protein n=1 Tax=Methylobacterium indicum TaxID=1775910 RepID=A0A0J6R332_9HYPH|nr:hypothetical protein [Methylobacterium indicum]KMO15076.1 hypothetical protein QR79_24740 [Methylobacterium indicum]KMO15609.1 hypothetical protein QR78_20855 [Methylobacterium indicum]KTS16237.1 hypothetical protein NS229_27295 [Methylobacterium indicum]KTS24498.1 hypothetical protein NS228_26890 [Methylobacterium indicum]KTS45735.1 hypothetical protein NS230_23335 [Methylobacterium indicum]
MLLHEITDALGVGGLFRDVLKPFDTYMSNGECEAGHAAARVETGPGAAALRESVIRRETVRRIPETVSARG